MWFLFFYSTTVAINNAPINKKMIVKNIIVHLKSTHFGNIQIKGRHLGLLHSKT